MHVNGLQSVGMIFGTYKCESFKDKRIVLISNSDTFMIQSQTLTVGDRHIQSPTNALRRNSRYNLGQISTQEQSHSSPVTETTPKAMMDDLTHVDLGPSISSHVDLGPPFHFI